MATAKPTSTPTAPARRRTAAAKPAQAAEAKPEPKEGKATPAPRRTRSAAPAQPSATAEVPAADTTQRMPDCATVISSLERRALVARAAYLRAASRGFAPGHEAEDWYAAEAEIDAQLTRGT